MKFFFLGSYDLSGDWNDVGVMGDVVIGKNPFSLAPWLITEERSKVVDLEAVVDLDQFISCVVLNPPKIDPTLFVRPFTKLAWTLMILTVCVTIFFLCIPSFVVANAEKKISRSIIQFTFRGPFFTIVHAYYSGAMVMFFANKQTLPFETLSGALDVVPHWKVLFTRDGYGKVIFEYKAEYQEISEYKEYLNKVRENPEEYMVDSTKKGTAH